MDPHWLHKLQSHLNLILCAQKDLLHLINLHIRTIFFCQNHYREYHQFQTMLFVSPLNNRLGDQKLKKMKFRTIQTALQRHHFLTFEFLRSLRLKWRYLNLNSSYKINWFEIILSEARLGKIGSRVEVALLRKRFKQRHNSIGRSQKGWTDQWNIQSILN